MADSGPAAPRQSALGQFAFWGALALAVAAIIWIRHGRPRGDWGSAGRRHPAVGRELTELELAALTGAASDVNLSALRGKIALISFWGTWCGPCRAEMPRLAQLRRELADHKDFRLLAVSCPGDEGSLAALRNETQAFLTSEQIDIPTYADPNLTTRRAVARALGLPQPDIVGVQTTVLVDRNGVIQAVWDYYAPGVEKDMLSAIKEVLQ
jgi:thiol-disulfide isomerase/thioredoxin